MIRHLMKLLDGTRAKSLLVDLLAKLYLDPLYKWTPEARNGTKNDSPNLNR